MSFAEAMKSLFGGPANAVQQPMTSQQQANPQNQGMIPTGAANPGAALPGTQSTQQTDNNGLVPTQVVPEVQPTPLDPFSKIWETTPTDPKANKPIFDGLDPAKLMESAARVDFSKAITPELAAKINAGGADAMQALIEAMGKVGQTVYAQSAFATTKIVDKALTEQQSRFEQNLPSLVKKLSVGEGLITDNPILNNPAVAPLVDALKVQLTAKNPNASSAEIQSQILDYFSALGTTFQKAPVQAAAKKGADTNDWEKFFN